MPAPAHPEVGTSVVAIISDTHLPRGQRRLPEECVARLRDADLIIHAGDLVTLPILAELRSLGEVVAVAGNVDDAGVRAALPVSAVVTVTGHRLAVVHDAGPSAGRLARMRRRFPEADAVIFGHSHIPLHEHGRDGFQIFNPGSPTERRRSPHHTMGIAHVSDHGVAFELITLD
ncbi:MAG: metallophosphoesterase family protein [Solirubrobacteraceae bacterium]